MILQTASEVISFTKELENKSAAFYQDLSQRYTEDEDVFLSFVKENGPKGRSAGGGLITGRVLGSSPFHPFNVY